MMASFFNLTLDTTAPAGLSLSINDGATYATSVSVSLTIGVSDSVTTGYQMKIWGTSTAANEGAASWETYNTSKSITLPSGDGLKTVSLKVRDDVGNESTVKTAQITLDTAVPVVTISGPDISKISKVASYDTSDTSFTADAAFTEYKVKVVPATNSLHSAGTQIPTTGGSTNTSGSGTFPKDTPITVTIKGADLETASSGDGVKIVKIFVKTAAGTWSAA